MVSADSPFDQPVTAVLVTFNSRNHILASIDSLSVEHQGIQIEVVVVDNGSSDGTADLVESQGRARVVRSDNLGYAAGVNAGARQSSGRGPILVLNPDTECLPGSVATMVATAEREHAVVAPKLLDADGRISPSIRRAPTLRRGMSLAFTGLPAFTERVEVGPEYELARPIEWATGAALLVPRECHEQLGGWDESFFMYSEETDFCLRASDHGWRVWFEPDAVVRHTGQGSGFSDDLYAMQIINRVRLLRRRRGAITGAAYWGMTLIREVGRGALGGS